MLRNLATSEQRRLLDCYNNIWWSGQVPEAWRTAIVAPILKSNKPANELSSYRPVSLTSAACKVMEAIALARLEWLARACGFLADQQTGFRCRRCTADSIADVVSTLEDARASGDIVMLLLIDVKGAFDGLPHAVVQQALDLLGIGGNLRRFLSSFLNDRTLRIAAENQRFSNSGSESIPQPPPHQSQTSGSSISTLASTAFHTVLGSMASKTADEAASAAAAEADACGDDAGNQQYGDPWDTDPTAVALRLLRAEDNRKSPTPAHATPAAKGVQSTNEVARQPVYEAEFDLRLKQREPDQGLDRMAQSPVPLIPGLQEQPLAGPRHPVPSSCSSSEVSLVPGRRGGITEQPSLRDACFPGPPPHQGSSGSISVSSSVQLQPAPTPCGSRQQWRWESFRPNSCYQRSRFGVQASVSVH
ncbi:hypothetical protein HPB49_005991 [Dermacentor silvarum]|uniref:Uncharacterized protein n=1 Tax=Dermacentor silvarum TaxID=543639 RepID=A0ACB8D359_DERSI|nr:hypothetical protein HPB49_005991 [Dermacentor silvarum]